MNRFEDYKRMNEKLSNYKEQINYIDSEFISLEREIITVMLNLDLADYVHKKVLFFD